MSEDPQLFVTRTPRLSHGRLRKGLDDQVAAARNGGSELPASGVAVLRTLADQIDQLERWCRRDEARPYDRIPLTALTREFRETSMYVFGSETGADPIGRALAAFLDTETGNAADTGRPD
jgi:hypothetical protein